MITTTKISNRIYHLGDSFECYATLVAGENRALLFDTCVGVDDLASAVREITDLPLIVVLSHGHFDHIGGAFQFDKVYLSHEDHVIIEDYKVEQLQHWLTEMQTESDGKSESAVNKVVEFLEEKRKKHEKLVPWDNFSDLNFDSVDLGGVHCDIIPLPGHSPGSVGVLVREEKMLLSGDTLTPIMTMMFPHHNSLDEYLETLRKVQELEFEYYVTGHHNVVYKKQIIQTMIDCVEQSKTGKFYRYQYPKPPYTDGWFHLYSIEEEPVGLIIGDIEDKSVNAGGEASGQTPKE